MTAQLRHTYTVVDIYHDDAATTVYFDEHEPVTVHGTDGSTVEQVRAMTRLEPCTATVRHDAGRTLIWFASPSWNYTLTGSDTLASAS